MDQLRAMRIFVRVAERGSLSAASVDLGLARFWRPEDAAAPRQAEAADPSEEDVAPPRRRMRFAFAETAGERA